MPKIKSSRCSNAQFVILRDEDGKYESIQVPKQWGELIVRAVNTFDESQIASPDSHSTPTEEKQNPLVAPLVEALRDVLPYLKDAKRCGRGLGTYWQEHAKVAIEKADTALAQAGQEPPKVTREQFVGAMANQMMARRLKLF